MQRNAIIKIDNFFDFSMELLEFIAIAGETTNNLKFASIGFNLRDFFGIVEKINDNIQNEIAEILTWTLE